MSQRLLIIGLSLFLADRASAFDFSFWVWQRSALLGSSEIAELRQAQVREIYWQVGTLALHGSRWSWRDRFSVDFPAMRKAAPFLRFVPVVRIESRQLFSPEAQAELAAILEEAVRSSGSDWLQIDYESPDRLMGNYQDFLRLLKSRSRMGKLSISALGHWAPFTHGFAGLTDEITPMFYDLNPSVESLSRDRLPPLLDGAVEEKQIAEWSGCPIPWKAGLPSFGRVTVLDATGRSRGNIGDWSLDEIWFSPMLTVCQPTVGEQTVFAVPAPGVIANTPVRAGERIVVRYPAPSALARLRAAARQAGAEGVVFFRLAESEGLLARSATSLQENVSGAMTLKVRHTPSGCISISNDSAVDLMPTVSPSGARGYALMLRAPRGSWREAIPGGFAKATTDHGSANFIGLDIDTVFLWFSHLRAGETITSGLIASGPLQWQIQGLDFPSTWHSLE